MADPNIQTLVFPVNTGTPGVIKTYTAEVNKKTGAMVVYDTTNAFQKDPVIRNEFTTGTVDPEKKWRSEYYWNAEVRENYLKLSREERLFLSQVVEPQSINQRAAFINKNYTQDQKNNLFPNMPRVQNTAPPSQSVSEGGSTLDSSQSSNPITFDQLNTLSKGIPGRPIQTNYGNLYYPTDLRKSKSDAIKFTMVRYGTKSYSTENLNFGPRSFKQTEEEKQINGTVVMSIQPTIGDYNSANWSGQEMGMLATAASGAALEIIDTGTPDSIGRAIGNTLDKETGLKDAVLAVAAQEAASTKGLLTRLTGAMFNNNLELLFMGPQLRQFTFNFKMSPRYKDEAEEVRKIIRFFKQGSAVQRSTTSLFLKAPNVFDIEYLYRENGEDNPHKSLNKIKTCALVNVSVDYTPTGSYMTFNDDGSMVSYTLSLTFNELEPVYEDEYSSNLNEIGY